MTQTSNQNWQSRMPADLDRGPLVLHIGVERVEIASAAGAARLLQSLSFDRRSEQARMLCTRLEAARGERECRAALAEFERWATACGLRADTATAADPVRHAA